VTDSIRDPVMKRATSVVLNTDRVNHPSNARLAKGYRLCQAFRQSPCDDLLKDLPTPAFEADLSRDEAGYLYLSAASISKYFAPDLPPATQKLIAATQGPWFYGCLGDKVTKAAWHDKPSWWVLSGNDQIIDPRLQKGMAEAIHAKVTEVASNHVSMLAKPAEVAATILAAAQAI
jgi:pimeloyl-ACP methyl ester carboxylesterase